METKPPYSLDQFYGFSGLLQAGDFYLHIRELIFTMKDINVPRRVISHWESFGLFDFPKDKGHKWRKFSFVEYVWIEVMRQLREFGFSLETMKTVKKELMTYFSLESVFKGASNDPEFWEQLKAEATEEEQEMITKLVDAIDNGLNPDTDDFDTMMDKLDLIGQAVTTFFNPLQILITNTLRYKIPVSILVFLDGSVLPETQMPFLPIPDQWTERKTFEPHIKISITTIIREFLTDDRQIFHLPKIGILEIRERKLLEIITSGEYEKVTVKFKDKEIDTLEMTKMQDVKRKIVSVLQESKYQDIIVKRHDGMITHIENTTRIKF